MADDDRKEIPPHVVNVMRDDETEPLLGNNGNSAAAVNSRGALRGSATAHTISTQQKNPQRVKRPYSYEWKIDPSTGFASDVPKSVRQKLARQAAAAEDGNISTEAASTLTMGRLLRQAYPERFLVLAGGLCLFSAAAANLMLPAVIGTVITIITKAEHLKSIGANVTSTNVSHNASVNGPAFHQQPRILEGVGVPGSGAVTSGFIATLSSLLGFDQDTPEGALNGAIILMLLLALWSTFFALLRSYTFGLVGIRVVARLRDRLFESVSNQEVGFFDANRTGEIVNRFSADTQLLKDACSITLSMSLRTITTMIGSLVICFVISWKLSLLTLAVLPVVLAVTKLLGNRMRKLSTAQQDALAAAVEVAEETISHIRTVRSFSKECFQSAVYADKTYETYKVGKKFALAFAVLIAVVMFLALSSIVFVMWFGAREVLHGDLSAGLLTTFLLYALSIGTSGASVTEIFTQIVKVQGANKRVFQLIDRRPREIVGTKHELPSVRTGKGPHILFKDVTFSYPTRKHETVLKNFTMELQPGTVTALVGQSGGGKSTVVSLLERFYDISPCPFAARDDYEDQDKLADKKKKHGTSDNRNEKTRTQPSEHNSTVATAAAADSSSDTHTDESHKPKVLNSGAIFVDGINIEDISATALRCHIGLVSQEPTLFAGTIRDNLLFGIHDEYVQLSSSLRDADPAAVKKFDDRIIEACRQAHAWDFIEKFTDGLDTVVGERGVRLSGGQKQRLCIARAILSKPSILLLDESTSALDAESEHLVQQALNKLMASRVEGGGGRTSLIIAHRLSTIKEADRVVVMERGRVVEEGSHEELLSVHDGVYAKLVERQLERNEHQQTSSNVTTPTTSTNKRDDADDDDTDKH